MLLRISGVVIAVAAAVATIFAIPDSPVWLQVLLIGLVVVGVVIFVVAAVRGRSHRPTVGHGPAPTRSAFVKGPVSNSIFENNETDADQFISGSVDATRLARNHQKRKK